MPRGQRRLLIGRVVSDKMDKTITVENKRRIKHPRFSKFVNRSTVVKAHDAGNEAREGDLVEVMSIRRFSKTKSWCLTRIIEKKATV